ncbi:MAG: molybdopterin-guanine dinucleotide biosynthesis protein B [Thermoplasmata archaeon]|nr:molybdopterin-guanine dinucleotide biosynthesis protein B [Thermoplasmata archaeon]
MILGVYGLKDSGKTTLVEGLTNRLTEMGYSVGTVKHTHLKDVGLDVEGSDTWKHARAGAGIVALSSSEETMFLVKRELKLGEIETAMGSISPFDLLLVEGFKGEDMPKIAVGDIEEESNTVLRFTDNIDEIVEFARNNIESERILARLPGLDCEKCGFLCAGMAAEILDHQRSFEDCVYYSTDVLVRTKVNGKKIPMGKFAKDVLSKTLKGLVSSLKGVPEEEVETIEIEVSMTEN